MKKGYILTLIVSLALVIGYFLFKDNAGIPNTLRALAYNVDIKDVTFQGYPSQKISAVSGTSNILIQSVKNVKKDAQDKLIEVLNNDVANVGQKVIVTDPYSGKESELVIPESLRPVMKTVEINGKSLNYYLINTNEVFSLKIFSVSEAKYKGISAVYFCPDGIIYKTQIFNTIGSFNEEKSLGLLQSIYCK